MTVTKAKKHKTGKSAAQKRADMERFKAKGKKAQATEDTTQTRMVAGALIKRAEKKYAKGKGSLSSYKASIKGARSGVEAFREATKKLAAAKKSVKKAEADVKRLKTKKAKKK